MDLHTAVKEGNVPRVSQILYSGVPVNRRNKIGMTALMYAAQQGNVRMIRFLLKKGANARLKEPIHDQTALIFATQRNHIPAMRELLRYSNINANTQNNLAAIHFAKPEGIRMLIRAGAKLKINNNWLEHNNKKRNLITEMMVRRGAARHGLSKMYTAMRMRKAKARTPGNMLPRTVFHPSRVERMITKYGLNWQNKV